MNQSSFIVGALLAGFVIYLAAKGRLSTYAGILWGPTSAALPSASGGSSNSNSVMNSAVNTAGNVAEKAIAGSILGPLGDLVPSIF